jgi:hypothetical protein
VGQIGTLYSLTPVFTYHDPRQARLQCQGWSTLGTSAISAGRLPLSPIQVLHVISGGVNIYPAEIEQVLIEHPAVADVAVFGIPDEEWGEQVKAVVQPHAQQRLLGLEADRSCSAEASVADQMPEEHRLRGGATADADRQAGQAAFARQVLAEEQGEGVGANFSRSSSRRTPGPITTNVCCCRDCSPSFA